MRDCPICEKHSDRLAERIAHEVLNWIAEKEGYNQIIHTKPNSLRDRQGKDFVVVAKGKHIGLFIQIKAFRILKNKILKPKLQRLKAGHKLRKGRSEQLDTADKLKQFMCGILKDSQKLKLCTNDSRYRLHFKRLMKNINLEKLLDSETDYDRLLAAYAKVEAYFNLLEKQLRHAELYPDVKVFLLVNTTEGSSYKKEVEKLKQEWLPIIREAMKDLTE